MEGDYRHAVGLILHIIGDMIAASPRQGTLAILEAAHEMVRHIDVPDYEARILYFTGRYYDSAGEYELAQPPLRAALDIYENRLHDIRRRISTLIALGVLDEHRGDWGSAKASLEEAACIDRGIVDRGIPDQLREGAINAALGILLGAQGDYPAAKPLYERALAITEQALCPDHPSVATSLNNLAALLDSQGDYAAAKPLLERALAIREKALGPGHAQTRATRANLAHLIARAEPPDARPRPAP